MSRFPNGRPDHLLGRLARPAPVVSDEASPRQPNNGNGDDVSDGDHFFSHHEDHSPSDDEDVPPSKAVSKKRHKGKPKPKVPWIGYDVVRGWSAVLRLFTIFSHQCDSTLLVSKHAMLLPTASPTAWSADTPTGLAARGSAKSSSTTTNQPPGGGTSATILPLHQLLALNLWTPRCTTGRPCSP